MAVRLCFAARAGRCLAWSEQGAARPHAVISHFLPDRVAWSFVGLLTLQGIFPTTALHVCGRARIDCRRGLDCFLTAESLALDAKSIRQPPIEERTLPCH